MKKKLAFPSTTFSNRKKIPPINSPQAPPSENHCISDSSTTGIDVDYIADQIRAIRIVTFASPTSMENLKEEKEKKTTARTMKKKKVPRQVLKDLIKELQLRNHLLEKRLAEKRKGNDHLTLPTLNVVQSIERNPERKNQKDPLTTYNNRMKPKRNSPPAWVSFFQSITCPTTERQIPQTLPPHEPTREHLNVQETLPLRKVPSLDLNEFRAYIRRHGV